MWSQLLRVWVVASLAVLSVFAQGREAADRMQITVLVYNYADVEPATLLAAQKAAAKTYEKAGVAIVWRNCPVETEANRCVQTADPDQLVLNIAHGNQMLTSDTYGVALQGRDGWGTVCDVFYDRIVELQNSFPRAAEPTILGIVVAHELGHLLLGKNSHSATGVMQAVFQYRDFIPTSFGGITFTRQQAKKICDRLKQIALMKRASY
jgi:hypothetical protein